MYKALKINESKINDPQSLSLQIANVISILTDRYNRDIESVQFGTVCTDFADNKITMRVEFSRVKFTKCYPYDS